MKHWKRNERDQSPGENVRASYEVSNNISEKSKDVIQENEGHSEEGK